MATYGKLVKTYVEEHNEENWDNKLRNFRANVKALINQISANNVEIERLQAANEAARKRLAEMAEPERKDFVLE